MSNYRNMLKLFQKSSKGSNYGIVHTREVITTVLHFRLFVHVCMLHAHEYKCVCLYAQVENRECWAFSSIALHPMELG